MAEKVVGDLAERLWLALHALPRDPSGRPPKMAHLEREHGISQGTLSRLLGGHIQMVGAATLFKMAKALEVDPTWLGTGVGDAPIPTGVIPAMPTAQYAPERVVVELDERYPNRALAARIAREGGVNEEAIESVLADELMAEEDPPTLWWLDQMRLREAMLRSRRLPGTPIDASTMPRPFAARVRRE